MIVAKYGPGGQAGVKTLGYLKGYVRSISPWDNSPPLQIVVVVCAQHLSKHSGTLSILGGYV